MNRYLWQSLTRIEVGQKWRSKSNGAIIEIYGVGFAAGLWEILTPTHRTMWKTEDVKLNYEMIHE